MSEQKKKNVTIADLNSRVEALQKDLGEANIAHQELMAIIRNHEDYIHKLLTYTEELDAITFIALYMNTGKLKAPDTGAITNKRMAQANALRINGRRALGEYREKERIKELKKAADKLDIYHDEDTSINDLEKIVNSTRAMKISEEMEAARKAREAEKDASTDSNQ